MQGQLIGQIASLRRDFPILQQTVYGKPLVYLDNAATTQKPKAVVDAIETYYTQFNANIHRGVHALSMKATDAFELARETVARFIGANSSNECIFVRGTTEAINLVANSFLADKLGPDDSVLITHMEHHANIVPWQMQIQKANARLDVVAINTKGELCLEDAKAKLARKPKLFALSYASNALGTINPVKELIAIAHAQGVPVLLDAAQAVGHFPVDVQALDCDFLVFSAHKMYGPTGVGVLYGKAAHLEAMPPYQGGGDMIRAVHFDRTEYAPIPHKFEAGTPDIAGVIALGACIDYLNGLDKKACLAHEEALLQMATEAVSALSGYRIIGQAQHKVSVLSFVHERVHAHDIGTILDSEGIAVRSGHHCAMPVMDFFGVAATTRASFAFYNTEDEVHRLVTGLKMVGEMLG